MKPPNMLDINAGDQILFQVERKTSSPIVTECSQALCTSFPTISTVAHAIDTQPTDKSSDDDLDRNINVRRCGTYNQYHLQVMIRTLQFVLIGGPRETPKAHTMLMKQVGNKRPTSWEPCRRHGRSQIFHVGSFSGHQSIGNRAQAIRKSTQKKPMYRLKKQQLSQSNTCKVD